MKKFILFVFLSSLLLTGCSQSVKVEGYVVKVNEDSLLVLKNATEEQIENLPDINVDQLIEEGANLTSYWTKDATKFSVGDKVKIWTNGNELTSYPSQAGEEKIKKID